jgi:hypothetical protein
MKKTLTEIIQEKENKLTFEEQHTRETFFIRNDLRTRFIELAKQHKRGFKTEIINYALEKALDEIEKKNTIKMKRRDNNK